LLFLTPIRRQERLRQGKIIDDKEATCEAVEY
jgi:hypothetical protein